ncbi:hypothetical protein GEMRC1_008036 [Eukaryota sp. GEM-RC1]
MSTPSCVVCYERFELGLFDPVIVCANNHTVCVKCADRLSECPFRCKLLAEPIPNLLMRGQIEKTVASVSRIPIIDATEITLSPSPFAEGTFSDVYKADWKSSKVAVKLFRVGPSLEQEKVKNEVHILLGLNHPNILRVFGTVYVDGRIGIVSELADCSLDEIITQSRPIEQKLLLAKKVAAGISYLHSRNIAHRDLKPGNVLMFANNVPKIGDFGTSKVLETLRNSTKLAFTVNYAAPELLDPERKTPVTLKTDIYSFCIILIELISQQRVFNGLNMMQVMLAVFMQNTRPDIPDNVPSLLRPFIDAGLSRKPSDRPSAADFITVIDQILETPNAPHRRVINRSIFSTVDEAIAVNRIEPTLPVVGTCWESDLEVGTSVDRRMDMVNAIREKVSSSLLLDSVLKAMETVPRHLFLHQMDSLSTDTVLDQSYAICPIRSTPYSNESSPELIAVMLSMIGIRPGHSVALIGLKGGYIQSLGAQLVGGNGKTCIFTGNNSLLDIVRDRTKDYPFNRVISFHEVEEMANPQSLRRAIKVADRLYDGILFCGSVTHDYIDPVKTHLRDGGKMLCIVQEDYCQRFVIVHKRIIMSLNKVLLQTILSSFKACLVCNWCLFLICTLYTEVPLFLSIG